MEDRSLRHGSYSSCIRGVGNRVPSKVPRHVCYSPMGCQKPENFGSSGSNRHQAALLQRPPWADHLRIRNQGAAPGPASASGLSTRRRSDYLSFLTSPAPQTLFADIRKLPGGTWLRVKAEGTVKSIASGTLGSHRRRSSASRKMTSPSRSWTSCGRGAATKGQRRAGRRVPLWRHRLQHQRGALFGRARPAGQDLLDRLSGRVREYQNELALCPQMARSRRRASRALLTMEDLLDFLPLMIKLQDEPIADPVCVPVYYVSELAREQWRHRVSGGRGRRRTVLGLPGVEAHAQASAVGRWCRSRCSSAPGVDRSAMRWERARDEVRVPSPRLDGAADFLGRRGGLHGARRSSGFFTQAARDSSTGSRRGTPSSRSATLREQGLGDAPLKWMSYIDLNVRLPELLAHARRQDEHGRQPRGARALPRPQVRRAGYEHSRGR